MLCAGVTVYSALLRSEAKPGQWVVIAGAGGGLGHLGCQIAAQALGLRVVGLDHGSKAEIATKSGAEHFVDFTQFADDDALAAHVKSLTEGIGAHAVIVCTASNKAYAQALGFLRFNGTLVCVGMPEGELEPIAKAFPSALVFGNQRIVGSAVGNQKEAIDVLKFAARGLVKAHVEIKPLEDLDQIFQDMHAGKLHGRVVVKIS
jgi:alcohol dehydrogenase, propanol-preferring